MTLQEIGAEMAVQNNRSTQYPMFAIMVDRKVYMAAGADDDLKFERKEDTDRLALCDTCKALYDEDEDLPEECDNCDDDAFYWYKLEDHLDVEMTGVFFTAKAAQNHIDANHYHYRNPRVYGIGAWRNPEIQLVQKHLLSLCLNPVLRLFKKALPGHYR